MNLRNVAKDHAAKPGNLELMADFVDRLAREHSIVEIESILDLDYERIAGPALRRLAELLPDDPDLPVTLAYWSYHYGMDDEAFEWLQKSKDLAPLNAAALKAEVFMSYDLSPQELHELVRQALVVLPNDAWLRSVVTALERGERLGQMRGPSMNSRWHKLLFGRADPKSSELES